MNGIAEYVFLLLLAVVIILGSIWLWTIAWPAVLLFIGLAAFIIIRGLTLPERIGININPKYK